MNFYQRVRINSSSPTTAASKVAIAFLGVAEATSALTLPITSGTNVKTNTTTTTRREKEISKTTATRPRPPSASPSRVLANTHDTIYRNSISTSLPADTSASASAVVTSPTAIIRSGLSPYTCCPTTDTICHCCCSALLSSNAKKNSRRFCDITSETDTMAIVVKASKEKHAEELEVRPPLTSMSAQQIPSSSSSSRRRRRVEHGDVANEETITATPTTSAVTTFQRRPTTETASPSPSLSSSLSQSPLPSPSPSPPPQPQPSPLGCYSSPGSRNLYRNIKMPLRRLMLTIMAAVVLSTEFTICGTTSILEQKLKVISLANNNNNSNNSNIPAATETTTATNKSSKVNDSLPNSPVTLTTTLTTIPSMASSSLPLTKSSSSSSSSSLSLSSISSLSPSTSSSSLSASETLSATSISSSSMERKSLKSLETAALTEALPSSSTSSQSSQVTPMAAVETAETLPFLSSMSSSSLSSSSSSSSSSSYLTATTLIQNEPLTLDDFNASSELLSGPTSILGTYDASDLPPLTEAEQAAKDLLTKGFSIPTYLPPFPVFAVADLPAYLNTVSTTTTEAPSNHHMSPDNMSSLENLLYFDNIGGSDQEQLQRRYQHRKLQIPRRNSSLAGANNVTVQEGNHAYLPCRIHRLQNKPVSWVRLRDGHIISVDQTTFIADQRFQAIFQDDKEYTWSLQIKYVQQTDEGWFECQASSEPKMSAKVYLKVIVPLTELIGDQSRFVKAGSKVALHCIVRGTLDPPQYIIWYRDKTQISDDNKMGWYTQLDRNIFGSSGDNENTIGSLIIPSVRKVDSGNYTCQPSNSASVSVDLHVLSGEYSASAIMSAARTYALNDAYLLILLLLMLLHNT